jgi:hypothetical protein
LSLWVALAACRPEPFALGTTTPGVIDAQGAFAATLATFTPGAGATSSSGDGANALGAPDGRTVDLGTGGQLDVVFGAGGIIEAPGADLRVHATVSPDAEANIYSSTDGSRYIFIGTMTGAASATGTAPTTPAMPSPSGSASTSSTTAPVGTTTAGEIELTVGLQTEAIFVRVVNTAGSVKIDALEALHPAFPPS